MKSPNAYMPLCFLYWNHQTTWQSVGKLDSRVPLHSLGNTVTINNIQHVDSSNQYPYFVPHYLSNKFRTKISSWFKHSGATERVVRNIWRATNVCRLFHATICFVVAVTRTIDATNDCPTISIVVRMNIMKIYCFLIVCDWWFENLRAFVSLGNWYWYVCLGNVDLFTDFMRCVC